MALLLPNVPEYVVTVLACASIGVVSVLMNPAYQFVEIEYMLKKTKAKGIVILDQLKTINHYEILKKICPELESSKKGELNSNNLPFLKHIIVANLLPTSTNDDSSKFKGTWLFNEINHYDGVKKPFPYVDIEDDFVYMFTSGTTGFPKVICFTITSKHSKMCLSNNLNLNRPQE